ncbi:MAG: NAD(P)H-dependent oxidoreductase [Desulfobacteraceae bacterium]|nr:NAD(P)H-dependent oxidoreductase [Desulfobacteraceae bacterium]
MNITVINGSPKTHQSITLQHIHLLEKENPDHRFEIIHIGNKIQALEKNPILLDEIVQKMQASDAVIFAFPVYYALVPSQLKRFFELLGERCEPGLFKGRYATSFSTSIRFFDHTAHNYVQAVCEDLEFSYVNGYSAHMDDFFHETERRKMLRFFNWFSEILTLKLLVQKKYFPRTPGLVVYDPDIPQDRTQGPSAHPPSQVLVLTDETGADTNLNHMTRMFAAFCADRVTVKNIHGIDLKNGCLGCCTCGYDNTCVQKDGFGQFYDENLKPADVIIIAGSIRDHYLSSQWKKFLDRSFFNGHVPVLQGKRLGFIVSGPLSQTQNLRETLEAISETWHMKSFGMVTDEHGGRDEITARIRDFARILELAAEKDLDMGPRFYRVAGGKVFRDFIYLTSAVFRADHLFYKKTGFYKDFPQKQIKKRIFNALFYFSMSMAPVRKKIYEKFIQGMVAPYKKRLKKL